MTTTPEQIVRQEDFAKIQQLAQQGYILAHIGQPPVQERSYPKFPTLYQAIPYPVMFLSVVGFYEYGCADAGSDVNVHGIYVLPEDSVLGLSTPKERYAPAKEVYEGYTVELVTYDLHKALKLLLGDASNGNILEMLYSPCRLMITPEYWQLRTLVAASITRHASLHYIHFAESEWKRIQQQVQAKGEIKVKSLINCYRLLLTGVHLMKTGEVETHIPTLTDVYLCPLLANLAKLKQEIGELTVSWSLPPEILDFKESYYRKEYTRLQTLLQDSTDESKLPDATPEARVKLNDFLVRVRKGFVPY